MLTTLIALATYWLILFAVCFILVEYGQSYLYDEVTPGSGWKVALGTFAFAAILTWARSSFDTMFTSDIAWTLLQAVVWFAVFTLLFQFQPPHALGFSLITFVLVSGMATLAVDSMTRVRPVGPGTEFTGPTQIIRRPVGPILPSAEPKEEAKPAP